MPPPDPVTMATLFSNRMLRAPLVNRCRNSLGFQILLETGQTHLATVSGLLVSAERRIGRIPNAAIDIDCARADSRGSSLRSVRVGTEYGARQPVRRVVGDAHGVVVAVVRYHRQDRAEDLLARAASVVAHPRDHGGLDEETDFPVGRPAAAAGERPALGDRRVEIALHPIALPSRDQWPANGSGVGGVAGLDTPDRSGRDRDGFVISRPRYH